MEVPSPPQPQWFLGVPGESAGKSLFKGLEGPRWMGLRPFGPCCYLLHVVVRLYIYKPYIKYLTRCDMLGERSHSLRLSRANPSFSGAGCDRFFLPEAMFPATLISGVNLGFIKQGLGQRHVVFLYRMPLGSKLTY